MALIVWDDTYSVGVFAIDTQHKRLIALLNELDEAMARGAGNETVGRVLDGLIRYTRLHFADEERLMQTEAYPDYVAHKRKHDSITAKVLDFQQSFRAGKIGVNIELLRFLANWLQQHINGSDKDIARHLLHRKAS